MVRAPLRLILLVALLTALGADAPGLAKKKKAPRAHPVAAPSAQMAALDGQAQPIGECVTAAAPDGSFTITVDARITLTSRGQVLACTIVVTPVGGGSETIHDCVERSLKAVAFPHGKAPLVTLERKWTFSAK